MATKIRLARGGTKKRPYYRIVITDSRSPRDGRFIEKVGTYNPLLSKESENRVTLVKERVEYWLGTGAEPTERVIKLLEKEGVKVANQNTHKSTPPQVKGPKKAKEA